MNLTALFIQRPAMTALVMMGILLFGVAGYRTLPVSDLPNIDFPTLQVQASLPGASPENMAASVATPLERLDRNIDAAAQDVQNAISAVARKLPPNMPAPPTVQKVNPADQPILFVAPPQAVDDNPF
jgi:hydrophobic/amphiphilic exporter-1 (mainly G- bacteria), HAE1 family